MTVDISKIRPGDEVTVRCRIAGTVESKAVVFPLHGNPNISKMMVEMKDIEGHNPKSLTVGDAVLCTIVSTRDTLISATGVIRAIQGGFAWVDCGTDDDPLMETVELGKLERVYD